MSGAEKAGRATHAVARWPAVVRTLVLLGVPPGDAQRIAALGVARLLDEPDEVDHEVALFAAVIGAWEDDRAAWWRGGAASEAWLGTTGYADVEPLLDRLDPPTRMRLLLGEVARLTPEQVDEVVVGGGTWPAELGPAVARVAEAIQTEPPAVDGSVRAARRRRARRRTGVVVTLVAAVAVAVGVTVAVVDPQDPPPPEDAAPAPVDATPLGLPEETPRLSEAEIAAVPVPWYDGTTVHLGAVTHDVSGLASLTAVPSGAIGVLADGDVVAMDRRGGLVTTLGRTRRGGTAVGSPSEQGIAWQDPDGDLVLATYDGGLTETDLPRGARIVGGGGKATYVDVPGGHLVARITGFVRRLPGPAPLDVAGSTRVDRTDSGLHVVNGLRELDLAGVSDARLSDDGRYLLTRRDDSLSGSLDTVFDVRRERTVRLPVPENGGVFDSAFGGDGTLVLVLARSDSSASRRAGPRGDFPGYEIVTCRLAARTCESAARLDTAESPPLLAH